MADASNFCGRTMCASSDVSDARRSLSTKNTWRLRFPEEFRGAFLLIRDISSRLSRGLAAVDAVGLADVRFVSSSHSLLN